MKSLLTNYLLWNKRFRVAVPTRELYQEAADLGLLARFESGALCVIGVDKKLIRQNSQDRFGEARQLALLINHWPNDRVYLTQSFIQSIPPVPAEALRIYVRDTIHCVRAVRMSKTALGGLISHLAQHRKKEDQAAA